jgi:hypothetical protein
MLLDIETPDIAAEGSVALTSTLAYESSLSSMPVQIVQATPMNAVATRR